MNIKRYFKVYNNLKFKNDQKKYTIITNKKPIY